MVGDVAHEVGHLTVCLDEHAVFLVIESAAPEPDSTVLLVDVTLLLHGLEAAIDRALAVLIRNIERALGEPAVEMSAEAIAHATLIVEHHPIRALAEVLHALGRVGIEPLVAVFIDDLLRNVFDVSACIARLGQVDVTPEKLLVAHGDRLAEVIHLGAMIVDVKLLVHVVTGMAHDTSRRIAECSPAAVANVHGAVGFAEMYSRLILRIPSGISPLPKSAFSERTAATTPCNVALSRRMLMKPGPAISIPAIISFAGT